MNADQQLLACAVNDTSLQVTNALELPEIHTDEAGSRLEFSWVATAPDIEFDGHCQPSLVEESFVCTYN